MTAVSINIVAVVAEFAAILNAVTAIGVVSVDDAILTAVSKHVVAIVTLLARGEDGITADPDCGGTCCYGRAYEIAV